MIVWSVGVVNGMSEESSAKLLFLGDLLRDDKAVLARRVSDLGDIRMLSQLRVCWVYPSITGRSGFFLKGEMSRGFCKRYHFLAFDHLRKIDNNLAYL